MTVLNPQSRPLLEVLSTESPESESDLFGHPRARDETMAKLGVRLEDRPGAPATWKREDPGVLAAERREAAAEKAKAEAAKVEKALAKQRGVRLCRLC